MEAASAGTRETGAATGRPTDDEILSQEDRIREAEVNTQALVSIPLPISILRDEYSGGSNPNFLAKIAELEGSFGVLRRARGDGNCFFRAFAFALVEAVGRRSGGAAAALGQALCAKIIRSLEAAGFERLAYEDFYEELVGTLGDAALLRDPDLLAACWQEEPHRSHSLVVLLRLVASAYLRTHAADYEPFIGEAGLDMAAFCQQFVECLGVESDQIHAIALGKALDVDVEIVYLDGSDGAPSQLVFPADPAKASPITVTLLYRPGHYDLLYRK